MAKREQGKAGTAEGIEARPSPGDEVRFIDPAGPRETDARVIGARGDAIDLVFRGDDGQLRAVEGIRHGPGVVGHWFLEGEVPKAPAIPMAGGRPITVGAAIRVHRGATDTTHETFSLVDGNVVELIGSDAFWAYLPAMATKKRLKVRDYCDRFRRGSWSWASDVIEVPAPRRYKLMDRPVRCPVSGESLPRHACVQVVVGPPPGRRGGPEEFLVAPEAAELLRRLLRGEPVELPSPTEPVA